MSRWICPNCHREFGNEHQSHPYRPSSDPHQTFAGFPAAHQEICEAIIDCLREVVSCAYSRRPRTLSSLTHCL